MSNTNDKSREIGTIEKRELAKLIEVEHQRAIESVKQQLGLTEAEILEKARKKFGVEIIEGKISSLKKEMEMLEKKKGDLGFTAYNNSFKTVYENTEQVVDIRTPAGKLFYSEVGERQNVQSMVRLKEERLKKLWLATDRKQIQKIVNQKIEVPMLRNRETKKIAA